MGRIRCMVSGLRSGIELSNVNMSYVANNKLVLLFELLRMVESK